MRQPIRLQAWRNEKDKTHPLTRELSEPVKAQPPKPKTSQGRENAPAKADRKAPAKAPAKAPDKAPAKPSARAKPAGDSGAPAASVCPPPQQALSGVYHPERLKVLDSCKKASGTVVEVKHEEDGDLHVNVKPDPAYESLLISGNYSAENGDLVVEFMARDGGHLPEPGVGDHLLLVGAYVNDLQHDWAEIHPVWSVSINGGPINTSGPRYGGSPEQARSYNAEGECATLRGAACKGYGSGAYSEESLSGTASGGGQNQPSGAASPSSKPPSKDYNCSDFQTQAEAQKYLLPGDPYRLDANHDGSACDSLP